MEITKVMEKTYLAHNGTKCPICKSTKLELIKPIGASGIWGHSKIRCHNCDAEWNDVWQLIGIDNLIIGSKRRNDG